MRRRGARTGRAALAGRAARAGLAALLLAGCKAFSGPEPADVVGEWRKADDLLPPVNLTLSPGADGLLARLSLSGTQLDGTAEIEGRRVVLTFPARPEPVEGGLTSADELWLRLGPGGEAYTLVRGE